MKDTMIGVDLAKSVFQLHGALVTGDVKFRKFVSIAGPKVETAYVLSLVLSVAVMGLFFVFFLYSRWGLAMRATAYSQQVSQSLRT
ncbi:hypothetical protein [Rhizobium sp. CC1099]|uniref:hypothetical protein n=1 Tax=Rhizobium sp. CC1099 TaxID=3039160 RepID=UPI0032C21ED9